MTEHVKILRNMFLFIRDCSHISVDFKLILLCMCNTVSYFIQICLSRDLENLTIVHSRPSPRLDDNQRQYNWEKGCADYMGADSFDNIQKQLEAKLQKTGEVVTAPASGATSK